MNIGILHPGEMGAALGAALVGAGHRVLWASEGRSPATAGRAAVAGLEDAGRVPDLAAGCDLVVSVCPPHAAGATARSLGPFAGTYLDANAIAPATAEAIARTVVAAGGSFVDGGIVGPPPVRAGTTRLYLSGPGAVATSEALATPLLEIRVVSEWPGAASALKAVYAAWTKGRAALLLTVLDAARAQDVEVWLRDEWRTSQPGLAEQAEDAARSAAAKGWRWAGEMEEIAGMLDSDGLPGGFHRAAAEVFRRHPRPPATP